VGEDTRPESDSIAGSGVASDPGEHPSPNETSPSPNRSLRSSRRLPAQLTQSSLRATTTRLPLRSGSNGTRRRFP
jgi:hypothetical protein